MITLHKDKLVVFDIETNALENPTELWCAVFKELDTNEIKRLTNRAAISEYVRSLVADEYAFIGHNAIDYDCKYLERLLGVSAGTFFNEENVIDTLVLSRMYWVEIPNGHSLEAWGTRLRFPKGKQPDFSKYSDEMLEYCEQDVELTHRVLDKLFRKLGEDQWRSAVDVEHRIAWTARRMHEVGFKFDKSSAESMLSELEKRVKELYDAMVDSFPPRIKVTELKTKTKVEEIPFNPGSPKQVVERLNEFGWKPVDKTKGHIKAEKHGDNDKLERFKVYGWMVNERNLSTLPEDAPEECNLLIEWLLTDSRRRTLVEWLKAYNDSTGRIHGQFNPLGTRTQRWTHSKPNMGNIPTAKTIKYNQPHLRELAIEYGKRMRSMWTCDKDSWLVGIDLEAAHLRIFAHLINDKAFIEALVSGDKTQGTDPHTMNKNVLGDICIDRDRAKTFIFTYLNGGGAPKVADIFNCSMKQAQHALNTFVEAYPGLAYLKKNIIPKDAKRGYCEGIDGRYIICNSAHHMMGVYLQSAESIIMKYFIKRLTEALDKQGINHHIVNCVHDEVVVEVLDPNKEVAEHVGQIGNALITEIGEHFKYNCPLAGEYKVGKTWYEVH